MGQRIAIIVAGGSGTRMGTETPKQFLPLRGKPVIAHTIEKFTGIADRIIVVLPEACSDQVSALPKDVEICYGGATRFESVKNALSMLHSGAAREHAVAVHDAVRPLVSRELVERAFAEAERHGTAIPYIVPVDTFRLLGSPIDRNALMAIQTPQTFRLDILLDAYNRPDTGFTDDASAAEAAGHILHFIAGERSNIKITTPEDLKTAHSLCE
jgi:2-C-methyl-D-erythritol 4-phosphate cytidylyltransferase